MVEQKTPDRINAMSPSEYKTFEDRLRRMARRQGLSLCKSRTRDPRALDFNGLMLADAKTGSIVAGGYPRYSMSVIEVESYLLSAEVDPDPELKRIPRWEAAKQAAERDTPWLSMTARLWIPVARRYPEECEVVLTMHINDLAPIAAFYSYDDWTKVEGSEDDETTGYDSLTRAPTHWMPLPGNPQLAC